MFWPSQSSGLNPMENVWRLLSETSTNHSSLRIPKNTWKLVDTSSKDAYTVGLTVFSNTKYTLICSNMHSQHHLSTTVLQYSLFSTFFQPQEQDFLSNILNDKKTNFSLIIWIHVPQKKLWS